jgi:hypothetical protein
MAMSLRCADTGADCRGEWTTDTEGEFWKHWELHVAEAHPDLVSHRSFGNRPRVSFGRSRLPARHRFTCARPGGTLVVGARGGRLDPGREGCSRFLAWARQRTENAPVFKLCSRSSEPFIAVCDLEPRALSAAHSCRNPLVLLSLLLSAAVPTLRLTWARRPCSLSLNGIRTTSPLRDLGGSVVQRFAKEGTLSGAGGHRRIRGHCHGRSLRACQSWPCG